MHNNHKVLLHLEEAIITSFPKYAHLFSIVGLDEEHILWIAKHFLLFHSYEYTSHKSIDLSGYDKSSLDNNPYPYSPYLEYYKIPLFIKSDEHIIEIIEENIKKHFFICININISKLKIFDGFSLIHPVLISGFDSKEKIFYVNDFYPPSSKYRREVINYNEITKGVLHNNNHDYCFLFRKKKVDIDIKKEIDLLVYIVRENLVKILYGDFIPYNPYYFKTKNLINYRVGLKVYDEIVVDLFGYGKKAFHVLLDSKIITYECLKVMEKYGKITNLMLKNYLDLVLKVKIMRNLFMKLELLNKEKDFSLLVKMINEVKNYEKKLILDIIKHLFNQSN